jgi:membrane-bound lytic murein transglycosylase D
MLPFGLLGLVGWLGGSAWAADPGAGAAGEEGVATWLGRVEGAESLTGLATDAPEVAAVEEDPYFPEHDVAEFYKRPGAVLAVDPLFLDRVDPSEFDIPIVVNPEVEKWVRYFTGTGRKHYARYLSRSTTYRPMMYREIEARGMPRDLVYLSMIESGYNPSAISHAGAAGMWQFMPATGRMYDLRVDGLVDDRRDAELSTVAAVEHLSDLYDTFGDWYLAFAAYNAGAGKIGRSVAAAGTKDFWTLARGSWLHTETDNYVPKIIAAAIIGKHPERYGFTDIVFQPPLAYDTVMVDGAADLEVLAECAGVSVDALKALNPALKGWQIPSSGHVVRVPVGAGEAFETKLAAVPASERVRTTRHVVARGETLSGIANRYGVSLSAVTAANGITNANHVSVGTSLVIPRGGAAPAVAAAAQPAKEAAAVSAPAPAPAEAKPVVVAASMAAPAKAPATSRPTAYTVARGDTLSAIADRYDVSVSELRVWNAISGDVITPGQRLSLKAPAASTAAARTHVVKSGETLSGIAQKYGVSTADLQAWNGIRNPAGLMAGTSLEVRAPAAAASSSSSWQTHTVKSGDTLSEIASRYGCSTSDLRAWNGLSGSTIQPGQKLKVRAGT